MSNSFRMKYEDAFKVYVRTTGARAFAKGRHGLLILLKALGIKEGDKIGVCGFTCFAVVEAIKLCGAIPIYLDVDENLCIDPKEILRQKPGSLKVVILQHTFGNPGKLDQLLDACSEILAEVIEDCSHALDCFWKGEPLGKFGIGAIYSFEWGKPYSTGQGGMLTVNSTKLLSAVDRQIEKLATPVSRCSALLLECDRRIYSLSDGSVAKRYLSNIYKKLRNIKFGGKFPMLQNGFYLDKGYVRLIDETTAKEGLKQLGNWPQVKKIKQDNTKVIEQYLLKYGINCWPKPADADVTMLRYPIYTEQREKVMRESICNRLDVSGWYISPINPLTAEELYKVDYLIGSCKKSEYMIPRFVYLPTGLTFNSKNLEYILKIIVGS